MRGGKSRGLTEVALAEVACHVGRCFPRLDHASCEDAAQTAFEELLGRLDRVERGQAAAIEEPLLLWLRRCAWRRARDSIRDSREDAYDPTDGDPFESGRLEPSLEQRVIARQELMRVIDAIGRLRDTDRAAYLLRIHHGLTVRQLAPRLGCSKSTAAERFNRAARAVHDSLAA